MVRDEQRRPVGRIRDTVKLSTEAADDLKKKTVQYETGFEMPPGKYHVKIVVRENQDGDVRLVRDRHRRARSEEGRAEGELGRRRHAAAAGARKNDRNPLMRDGRELVPNVTHVVSPGQHLYFYYEVYDPAQPVKVMTSIAFFRGKVRAFETPVVRDDRARRIRQEDRGLSVRRARVRAPARPLHLPDQRGRRCRGKLHLPAAAAVRPALTVGASAAADRPGQLAAIGLGRATLC